METQENRGAVSAELLWKPYRSHANGRVGPTALDRLVKGLAEHAAQLHGVAVHSVDPRPPVQRRLQPQHSNVQTGNAGLGLSFISDL